MSVVQITHKSNDRSSTGRCHAPEHGISHWLICRYTTRPTAIVNVKVRGATSRLSLSHIKPSAALSKSRLRLRSKRLMVPYSALIRSYSLVRPENEL